MFKLAFSLGFTFEESLNGLIKLDELVVVTYQFCNSASSIFYFEGSLENFINRYCQIVFGG